MNPSDEQKEILKAIINGQNVFVNAVAGSGKTTTVLSLAQSIKPKRILQITYNKLLKFEVREKVLKQNIDNIEIHTYHSLCVKYYNKNGYTDGVLQQVTLRDDKLLLNPEKFDILVIDETQDMSFTYYHFIKKFIKDSNNKIQLLLLGDVYQGIYEFKNSDSRFLSLSNLIWDDYNMITLPLNTSYRLTQNIANFVNVCMLGENRIKVNKVSNDPIIYIRNYIYDCSKLLDIILNMIKKENIKPDDIFVLSASVNSKSKNILPCKKLENKLIENNIPCFAS